MKKIFTIASLLCFSVAQAAEFKVFDVTQNFALPHMTKQAFAFNAELGRSWVEIKVSRSYDENEMADEYRVKVPGLSYDATSESVMIESEGQIVECAKFVSRGRFIFRQKVLELTDRCRFEQRTVVISKDNGFEVEKDKRLQIFLIVE